MHDDLASASSLAYYRQSRTGLADGFVACPARLGLYALNINTGQRVPAGCDRLACPVCVRKMARKYAQAIGLAQPERSLLLTQVGDDWPTIQGRVYHLRKTLRRRGLVSHDVFHVEPNPAGTGHHIHAWQWGDPMDQVLLAEAAISAGMGRRVEVHSRRAPAGAPLDYGMKHVVDDDAEGPALPPLTSQFLRLNGGRLGHATRGFWRDESGHPLAGVRDAYRAVARQRGEGGEWVLTTDGGAWRSVG